MVQIINKDLLSVERGLICHQVNCVGVMGAGLAKAVKQKYPQVYTAYKSYPDWDLGHVQYVKITQELYIANMAGQFGIGTDSRQTDFTALEYCFKSASIASSAYKLPLYFPYKLGSGLAGGATEAEREETWETVLKLIEEHCPDAIICRKD